MGKPKTLPPTKAESAEERLEELVKNKSAFRYRLFLERDDSYSIYIMDGECRAYPDGFEALDSEEGAGILYVQRRNATVYYDFRKDSEAQEKK
ncbi:MAG: hypothetical protein Q8O03_02140 [Nanoarchaeota archaeon]|nr:hypothetical protein [Nanoarchaeota archaeon]